MTHCHLYYPGLLGPNVPVEELAKDQWPDCTQLPHLCRILARGHKQALNKTSLEARILHGLGVQFDTHADVPLAALRAHLLSPQIDNASLWCLDPVHVQIDQEEAVLLANESLDLSESEARHLIDDLNAHFAEDGLVIHYHKPHQWVLQGQLALTTQPLSEVMQNSIDRFQPAGHDETRWRKLVNELQMLLHAHPVNQAREQQGMAVVNSAWLWGGAGGEQPAYHYEALVQTVFCNEQWVHDVAVVCDIVHTALPEDMRAQHFDGNSLLIFLNQLQAIKQHDVYAWFKDLKQLNDDVLGPMLDKLANGRLDSLTLYSDTLSLTLHKNDLKSSIRNLLKREKAFDKSIIQLRKHYGH